MPNLVLNPQEPLDLKRDSLTMLDFKHFCQVDSSILTIWTLSLQYNVYLVSFYDYNVL